MKKIFTLLAALMASISMMAQMSDELRFAGKANISIAMFSYSADSASDTVIVSDGNKAITLPALSGNGMAIPSMKIGNLTYSMTGNPMTGTAVFTWEKADTTITVGEKQVQLTNFKATYERSNNRFTVSVNIKYGVMPAILAYTMEGYYLKAVAGETTVSIGGVYNYTANPTYTVRKYVDEGTEKLDVEIPTYFLENTAIGDLTVGTYTVKGLTYDEQKGGYYRDYANDNLTMHFKAVNKGTTLFDADYALAAQGGENILVQYNGSSVVYICNNFKPGAMPYSISEIYGTQTGINQIENSKLSIENSAAYNLSGQRVSSSAKGIIIRGGKKFLVK